MGPIRERDLFEAVIPAQAGIYGLQVADYHGFRLRGNDKSYFRKCH
mgnify:CR=1